MVIIPPGHSPFSFAVLKAITMTQIPNPAEPSVRPGLISIDTLIERPKICIDGVDYELTSPEELTVLESVALRRLGEKLDALMKTADPDEETARKMIATIDKITAIIMRFVPRDVRARLSETQALKVVEVFTMLLLAGKAKLAGGAMMQQFAGAIAQMIQQPSTKDKLKTRTDGSEISPASSGSTAANRADG